MVQVARSVARARALISFVVFWDGILLQLSPDIRADRRGSGG